MEDRSLMFYKIPFPDNKSLGTGLKYFYKRESKKRQFNNLDYEI